ncbi:MAG: MmoB/DmpM family protein [Acidobacteriia bacterium]|nr:MmoB/DmpM family protein [Methyloceanibacter sp.]MBX5472309.1 MmoB/DmpM family protein [Acetobacteraceae bacterium]MCL6492178.1 MmoB/DmpM family protein [Terriglobia bacterium]
MSNVFIALQDTDEARPIIEAILADNPQSQLTHSPAMVKIDVPNRLVIRRERIEEITGLPFDLQRIHVNLISLSGHIEEDDDQFVLSWKR